MTSLTSSDSELVDDRAGRLAASARCSRSRSAPTARSPARSATARRRRSAQLAIATFDNPHGLVDNGGNQFTAGPNSGVAVITTPLTLGAGAIRVGALELSNVDLSEEFINMIISSTGFTASSRVITTSDQLLTELLNSAR